MNLAENRSERSHAHGRRYEIDWDSTLVSCADEVADVLLAHERLEAFDVGFDDDLSWHGDTVNPRPSWLS